MVSISSKSAIIKRTLEIFSENAILYNLPLKNSEINNIRLFLQHEYKIIPENERIGKGSVYIAINVASGFLKILEDRNDFDGLKFSIQIFNYGKERNDINLKKFSIAFLAETVSNSESMLIKVLNQAKSWANDSEWEIREMSGYIIRKSLKNFPEKTLQTLKKWLLNEKNPNIKRLIAESLRPLSDVKWLRNPEKNDEILDILNIIRADPSEYVRKSVGNNLKDLSKYMPKKILKFIKNWIKDANIIVDDELASRSKKELGEQQFYLIWTIKHGLRWLKERNPEYFPQIQEILGKNYILYFNEKRNRTAKPK